MPHSVRAVLPLARRPREVFEIVRGLEQPITALFSRCGLGGQAQDAIVALVHLHNTPPNRCPALLVAALLQHYFKAGAFFPELGGQVLAANLTEVIQSPPRASRRHGWPTSAGASVTRHDWIVWSACRPTTSQPTSTGSPP
ncbi:MAG: putative ferredoxin--NADP reductase/FAD dependent oxidoreductase [Solirubrobacterales bacterium]|nr:putative ferredoxin--NADP reductase/FAD dependent oxidoreductase [Solirubrobacterales bacterium]